MCPFYKYYHGYYCMVTQKTVTHDVYRKYCDSFSTHKECPIYKDKNRSSGGCYLTSACVESHGLPDDCHELMTMRALRDKYIRTMPEGDAVILDYYEYAPKIVDKINQCASPKAVFEKIYSEMILPCVQLFDAEKHHEAYVLYKEYAEKLKKDYLAI